MYIPANRPSKDWNDHDEKTGEEEILEEQAAKGGRKEINERFNGKFGSPRRFGEKVRGDPAGHLLFCHPERNQEAQEGPHCNVFYLPATAQDVHGTSWQFHNFPNDPQAAETRDRKAKLSPPLS